MFGCELPVIAYRNENFVALPELVVDGYTGKVFSSPKELSSCLKEWFSNFLNDQYNVRQNNFKNNIQELFKNESWETHWKNVAKPCFQKTFELPIFFIIAICAMSMLWLCYTYM